MKDRLTQKLELIISDKDKKYKSVKAQAEREMKSRKWKLVLSSGLYQVYQNGDYFVIEDSADGVVELYKKKKLPQLSLFPSNE